MKLAGEGQRFQEVVLAKVLEIRFLVVRYRLPGEFSQAVQKGGANPVGGSEAYERLVIDAFAKQLPQARQIRPRTRCKAEKLEFRRHPDTGGHAVEAIISGGGVLGQAIHAAAAGVAVSLTVAATPGRIDGHRQVAQGAELGEDRRHIGLLPGR